MRGTRTDAPASVEARGPARIYPPREDTLLLLDFARTPDGMRLLEVGTGSGLVAITAARAGARVVATDRNPAALASLRRRARAEGLRLDVVRTDLARGLGAFERVLANPPYLPTLPEERDPDPWVNLALDGGPDGTRVLERLLRELPEHLAPGGVAFVLVSSLQDHARRAAIAARWRAAGGTLRAVAERSFEGERLEVWRLTREKGGVRGRPRPVAPRRRARGRGRPLRPRSRSGSPAGSSRAPARGTCSARGAA